MASVLEKCGSVQYTGNPEFLRFGDHVVRHRVVDEATQLDFTLTWPHANAGMARAVRDHYRANRTGTFQFVVPDAGVGGGATLECEYIEPPRITRRNYQSAQITVRIRRALLID